VALLSIHRLGKSRWLSAQHLTLLLVIVHCAQCDTTVRPGDDVCPNCQTADHLMVGTHTPSGMRVSTHRDAKRLRIQGRRHPDGHMTYRASVGGPMPVPASSYEPKKAPRRCTTPGNRDRQIAAAIDAQIGRDGDS
jgi:hypothetical protein